MAEYISFQPKDYYFTKTYTGNSSTQNFTDIGFQPNMVWIKDRDDSYNHQVHLAVRDEPYYFLRTNNDTTGDTGSTNTLTAFTSTGFNLGDNGGCNNSGDDIVAWCWKGGTTSGLSGGTITPSAYNINATAGIGTYKWSGTGSNGTIAHGLGSGSKYVQVKRIDTAGYNWKGIHSDLASGVENVYLNTTSAEYGETATFNSTFPDDTVFSLGTNGGTNASGGTYIAWVWCEKKGFSKMGSYTGNGNADGTFVYTGFRPAFFMVKRIDSTNDWYIVDNKRLGYNVDNNLLFPNLNAADNTGDYVDILSNGLKTRTTDGGWNASGATYIYMAFAEFPTVSSNDIPGVAR